MSRRVMTKRRTLGGLAALVVVVAIAAIVLAAPGGAAGGAGARGACRPLVLAKARVHAAAQRRETTLAALVVRLQARRDPWSLNGAQIGALQQASSGIGALDARVQAGCYATVAALRADAAPLFGAYRVYWLRVPQTRGIEAADRLATARAHLGVVAAKLAAHVGTNVQAKHDLDAMNAALAAADAKVGVAPTPSSAIAAEVALAPAADMTADDAAMEAARADLVAARSSLVSARADGLAVIADLGG